MCHAIFMVMISRNQERENPIEIVLVERLSKKWRNEEKSAAAKAYDDVDVCTVAAHRASVHIYLREAEAKHETL